MRLSCVLCLKSIHRPLQPLPSAPLTLHTRRLPASICREIKAPSSRNDQTLNRSRRLFRAGQISSSGMGEIWRRQPKREWDATVPCTRRHSAEYLHPIRPQKSNRSGICCREPIRSRSRSQSGLLTAPQSTDRVIRRTSLPTHPPSTRQLLLLKNNVIFPSEPGQSQPFARSFRPEPPLGCRPPETLLGQPGTSESAVAPRLGTFSLRPRPFMFLSLSSLGQSALRCCNLAPPQPATSNLLFRFLPSSSLTLRQRSSTKASSSSSPSTFLCSRLLPRLSFGPRAEPPPPTWPTWGRASSTLSSTFTSTIFPQHFRP